MSGAVVLMYHALWRSARERDAIDPADRPYALQLSEFARQIDMLRERGIELLDPAALRGDTAVRSGVVITFDDGHASNAQLALPLLRERGLRAAFFITTGFVGMRSGYCSVEQLRELDAAGMEVGGHGHSHRFLSDLADAELESELDASRRALREWLGKAPSQMSFPGGRFDPRVLRAAARNGFELLYGSMPGRIALPLDASRVLPRIAVRPGQAAAGFLADARGDAWPLLRARGVYAAKAALRRVLGNSGYHRLYQRIKG